MRREKPVSRIALHLLETTPYFDPPGERWRGFRNGMIVTAIVCALFFAAQLIGADFLPP